MNGERSIKIRAGKARAAGWLLELAIVAPRRAVPRRAVALQFTRDARNCIAVA